MYVVTTAFLDSRARSYDATYDADGPGGHVLRARMAAALDLVGTGKGSALDVAMGGGRLCEQLAKRGWQVFGVDLSPEMVRLARARLPDAMADRFQIASLERLPFTDASFEVVTATGVLEYSDRLPAHLRELSRVLRPGGLAVLSIPNMGSLHVRSRLATDPIVRLLRRGQTRSAACSPNGNPLPRQERFTGMVAASGLNVTAVRCVGSMIVPYPFDRLVPRAAARLARAFESAARGERLTATQLVCAARKPAEGVHVASPIAEGGDGRE